MAVRIRLKRQGRRHHPTYRVTAVDARASRDGKVLEELGQYDPCNRNTEAQVNLNQERIAYWLSVGAQPSDTVRSLMRRAGMVADQGKK